jgi:segregation and condensation protein A
MTEGRYRREEQENTMADRATDPTLSNYQLRLPAYQGPLDVLLRLIERSQLAIEDVSLVAVTDQFLQFVAEMDAATPAVIAEFAAVGARLTVLKSRSLLPRPVADTEEPEQSDLTQQLREYKRIKDLAKHLGELHGRGLEAHGARAGAIARPTLGRHSRLMAHDAPTLVRALRRRISTLQRPQQLIVQRRAISLRDLVSRLAGLVSPFRSVAFSEYTRDLKTRTEVATAFLAVLVLVRRGQVQAAQDDLFAEIELGQGSFASSEQQHEEEFLN